MPIPLRLTQEQVDRLTEKVVDRILSDENPADIMQLLERAELVVEDE